jgi:hypothetical protein
VAWNMVIYLLVNRMGIQQLDHLIKTLMFKFDILCIEKSMQYRTGIISIEILLNIHLILNLSDTLVRYLFILNDLCQLL